MKMELKLCILLFCHSKMELFLDEFKVSFKLLSIMLFLHIIQQIQFCQLILIYVFIYLFMAVLGLHCCAWAFSSGERGLLFVVVLGLLMAVAFLAAEHWLQARVLQQLWLTGSRVQAQQLWHTGLVAPRHVESSWTRDQTCPLHWQADS